MKFTYLIIDIFYHANIPAAIFSKVGPCVAAIFPCVVKQS